ncbi:hypothetical protein RDI58_004272 [Solanum bulbocastanum]
MKGIV